MIEVYIILKKRKKEKRKRKGYTLTTSFHLIDYCHGSHVVKANMDCFFGDNGRDKSNVSLFVILEEDYA